MVLFSRIFAYAKFHEKKLAKMFEFTVDRSTFDKGGRALSGYLDPPLKNGFSQVSSY